MLHCCIFLCGAALMIIELTGSRILAPFFGTSLVVWTSLIGIILTCLSLGAWWGGVIADRRPDARLLGHIILLSAWATSAIGLSKTWVLEFLQGMGNLHILAVTATLVLFAPAAVLLGMVTPFAVRLCLRDPEYAGRTSGGLYAVSTIGSIAGTFIAGFVLIAWLGNTAIILATAALLAFAALLLEPSHRLLKTISLVAFLLMILLSRYQDLKLAGLGFIDKDTPYNRVLVYAKEDYQTGRLIREMVTGPGGRQSAMFLDDVTGLAVAYTRFYRLVEYYQPAMRNMLVLGGGGYSFPKYALKHYPNVTVDVVELDPGITELARNHFGLVDDFRLKVIEEDARTFLWSLQKSSTRYDVILCDVFTSHYSIPFHMVTREAATLMKEALNPHGVILVNVLASLEGKSSHFYKTLYATYSEVFDHIDLYAVQDPNNSHRRQNIIIVAGNSLVQQKNVSDEIQKMLAHVIPKPQDGFPPFTDEFAPVDRYLTKM